MDLKVDAGIVAWLLSGPLYIPIWIFFWATPTTRNVDWLICTVRPTTSSVPKRSLASFSPRKTTRRFSAMSSGFRKRPPACGMEVPHLPELRLHATEPRVDAPRAHGDRHEPGVLDGEHLDLGDAGAQEGGILLLDRDRPPRREPHVGPGRRPRPDDGDALPHPSRALGKGELQPLAEGEEEDDRQGPPGDGEDGEDDPLGLVAEVGPEEAPDEGELGGGESHESLSATTGSRSDARRAGK